jgi:hypothetical protein
MREHDPNGITQQGVRKLRSQISRLQIWIEWRLETMREKHNSRRTFRTILTDLEAANTTRLMERARLANRLAKSVAGRPRSNAYRVKHSALRALTSRLPDRVQISRDPSQPEFVVVSSLITLRGLHVPKEVFEGQSLDHNLAA